MRLAQADSKAAAVMNEVDAVIRRIAKPLLMASDFLEIGPAIASLFSKREGIRRFSTKAYRVVR